MPIVAGMVRRKRKAETMRRKIDIRIINKSKWPDWFVKFVYRWVAMREPGLPAGYVFTILEPSSMRQKHYKGKYFRGLGWRSGQRTIHGRRFRPLKTDWPYTHGYARYKWSKKFTYRNRVEHFIGLISHEAHHSTGGDPNKFMRGGRCDNAAMEMTCERAEFAAVEAWRAGGSELRARVRAAARRAAATAERRRMRIVPAAVEPAAAAIDRKAAKLAKANRMLAMWTRKHKLATTKMKKYGRQVRALTAAAARIAADR